MSTITVAEVKDELRKNGTLTVDDTKIQRFIDAAEAEYSEWVGPLAGSVTETFDGGGTTLVLRQPVSAISAAAYDSGSTLTYTDLTVSNGIVRWGYGTAGQFTAGTRVAITYTVPSLPANHREVIIEDVAGYFAVTQRGPAGPALGGQDEYEAAYASNPQVLFPRIRALAKSYSTVA